MNNNDRRVEILKMLQNSDKAITASILAEKFGVTRQIIVSDIALLRATGNSIKSEKRGYYLQRQDTNDIKEIIICKHDSSRILDELFAIVDNGAKVLNVIVEHPIYGQITGDLNIASRYDAQEFVKSINASSASQLCDLTNGVHYHTISCPDADAFERIKADLKKLDIIQDFVS